MHENDPSRVAVQAVQASKLDPSDRSTWTLEPLGHGSETPHESFPTCPRCGMAPLRFTISGDCTDSTGGGTYRCIACGYTTARDLLVAELLRRTLRAEELLFKYSRLSLPGYVRELYGDAHRCHDCEAR